jgi:hypothetical protein
MDAASAVSPRSGWGGGRQTPEIKELPDGGMRRPRFGMSKGTRTMPGHILYRGRYVDQRLLYQVGVCFRDNPISCSGMRKRRRDQSAFKSA